MKPLVMVFETKEYALFAEWDKEVNSQQGINSEDVRVNVVRLSDLVGLSDGVGSSGTQLAAEKTETDDLGYVESIGEGQDVVMQGAKATSSSYPGEGILINSTHSKSKEVDLGKLRYFYKIPKSVDI